MTEQYDYIVIGGGSGGLASARRASSYGARVALIEGNRVGGTCVNRGCVPKKILWNAAKLSKELADSVDYGFALQGPVSFDYRRLLKARTDYINFLVARHEAHLTEAHIDTVEEFASLTGPGEVRTASGRSLRSKHVLLATGTQPAVPNIPGAELGMTSDGWFEITELPQRLLVVGGGFVGVEFASIARALGCAVTLAFRGVTLLERFDRLIQQELTASMRDSKFELLSPFLPSRIERTTTGALRVHTEQGLDIGNYDGILWAIGRVPNVHKWVNGAGVELDERGFIRVDDYQNTNLPGVYAVGDITGRACHTPVAVAAGRRLADRLFGNEPRAKMDYEFIPSVVFSHPPIGTVGLSEDEAVALHGDRVSCYQSRFHGLFHALSQNPLVTAVKMVTLLPDERIIGLHSIGYGSEELLQGFVVALRMGACKRDFDHTIGIHPTVSEEFVTLR